MKKKLNLNELKVQSFVTSMDGEIENTVKGGLVPINSNPICEQSFPLLCGTLQTCLEATCGVCAYSAQLCVSELEPCEQSINVPCQA
ncbi:MAG: pinensin family lanthipeptide [Bacteroidota bacterium]